MTGQFSRRERMEEQDGTLAARFSQEAGYEELSGYPQVAEWLREDARKVARRGTRPRAGSGAWAGPGARR